MTTLQWMAYAIAISTLLGAAAALLERALRAYRVPVRGLWILSMAASVGAFVVTASSTRPDTRLADALVRSAVQQALAADTSAVPVGVGAARSTVAATRDAGAAPPARAAGGAVASTPSLSARLAAWTTWVDRYERRIVLATVLLVPLIVLVEKVRLSRERRGWRAAELDGVPVLVAPDFGPALVGIVAPRIVVPAYVRDLPADQRAMLLLHEQEHLRAHDGRLAMLSLVLVALCPWNPALLWQFARLRLAIEIDCDRRVLRRRADARGYGELLIDVAERSTGARLQATAFSDRGGSLRRRLAGIAPTRRERSAARAVMSGGAALVALAAACVTPRPTEKPRTLARTVPSEPLDRALGWLEADSVFVHRDTALVAVRVAHDLPRRFVLRPTGDVQLGTTSACAARIYDVRGNVPLLLRSSVSSSRTYRLADTLVRRTVAHGYYEVLPPSHYGMRNGELLRVGCSETTETNIAGTPLDPDRRNATLVRRTALDRGTPMLQWLTSASGYLADSVLVTDGRVHVAFTSGYLAALADNQRWDFAEKTARLIWWRYGRDAGVDTVSVSIVTPPLIGVPHPRFLSRSTTSLFYAEQLNVEQR